MRLSALILLGCLSIILLIGLNWPWAHAGTAMALHGKPCPSLQLNDAHTRLTPLFGKTPPNAVIRCLETGVELGIDVSHGTTRFAPLLPAFILIGPQGRNTDVIAHELAHAHIADLSSALLRSYKLPSWFDEGLAMQVDHRADYTMDALATYAERAGLTVPHLRKIARPNTFFNASDQGKVHYALARCVVRHWIDTGNDAVALVRQANWRAPFPAKKFTESEKACLALRR